MHNNTPIVPYISLCSGYEGIGLGLHRCIPNLRCIAYCEREAFAVSNVVAKMEKGLLDAAPVFTDVTTFPWEQFAPYMAGGILSFGWPCQPVSMAGKRKATEDERWLFDIIADGISILKPGMLFAENVEGLLSAKMPDGSLVFSHCIERLERLHYKVEAGIFSASEVGAPHQRKRVFIMAYRSDERLGCWETERWAISDWSKRAEIWNQPIGQGGVSGELANSKCEGSQGGVFGREDTQRKALDGYFGCSGSSCGVWPSRPGEPQSAWEPPRVVGNSTSKRSCGSGAEEAMGNASQREDLGRESRDLGTTPSQGGCGNNAFDIASEAVGITEQQQYDGRQIGANELPCGTRENRFALRKSTSETDGQHGQTQPPLGGDTHGTSDWLGYAELCISCDNRTDELRLLGNGVVPATATRAFLTLLEKITK